MASIYSHLSHPFHKTQNQDEYMSLYPSISHGDGELDLHEDDTGLDREIILRRVNSRADGDEEGAG